MHNIIVIGQVEDLRKWEDGFRTHGELFKSQTVVSPVNFATPEGGDEVAILFRVTDLETYMKIFESEATAEAMAHDGVKRETVRVFVLDKEFAFEEQRRGAA